MIFCYLNIKINTLSTRVNQDWWNLLWIHLRRIKQWTRNQWDTAVKIMQRKISVRWPWTFPYLKERQNRLKSEKSAIETLQKKTEDSVSSKLRTHKAFILKQKCIRTSIYTIIFNFFSLKCFSKTNCNFDTDNHILVNKLGQTITLRIPISVSNETYVYLLFEMWFL